MEITVPSYKSVYSIKIPVKVFDLIENVDEYELGKAIKMILIYGMNDSMLNYKKQQMFTFYNADPRVRSVFNIFKEIADPQIKRYKEIVDRNRKNGRKGGRPCKDGSPAKSKEEKELYQKRELLEEILRDYGLPLPKKEETKSSPKEVNEEPITPLQLPYFYEEYDTMSSSAYYDVINL